MFFSFSLIIQGHLFTEVLVMLSVRFPHLPIKDNQTPDVASLDF